MSGFVAGQVLTAAELNTSLNLKAGLLANIAALRALMAVSAPVSIVEGYYTPADGGGGIYSYAAGDNTSTDNGGTIIVDSAGNRWYLETLGQPISVKQFGAKGDGTTNDSAAIQAALNAVGAVGGGIVYVPPTGSPYLLLTGVVVPAGVCLMGAATRQYQGMTATQAQWCSAGTWIVSGDTTNPAVSTSGHGASIKGINFFYVQPTPGTTFTPITYPYTILVQDDFVNLEDIWIVAGTHGISIAYTSTSGGGTGVNLKNIMLMTLVIGIHTDCVNDTMCWDDVHVRPLWYAETASMITWLYGNLIGWDCHYCDNPMIKGLEFFYCKTAIQLTDNTCLGNTHSLYNALLSDVQHFGNQFIVCAATTTTSRGAISGLLLQSDTGNSQDGILLDFASDNAEWVLSNVRVPAAGGQLAAIGNGTSGVLAFDNLVVDAYSTLASGQVCIGQAAGSQLVMGSRLITKVGNAPGAFFSGGGAGSIDTGQNWAWQLYSVEAQYTVTGTAAWVGFSTNCQFNPIAAAKLQGRILGTLTVTTAQSSGSISLRMSNFTEIEVTGIAATSVGAVSFDSNWIDLSSATNILGGLQINATTGVVVESGDITVLLR